MQSYLDHLACTHCDYTCSHSEVVRTCPQCGRVLFARYDMPKLKREVSRKTMEDRAPGLWRFFELLPVQNADNIVTLGEGGTPLLEATTLGKALGLGSLYIKDESPNPTGTFKARGMSAMVSRAKELGITRFSCSSTGNAAGALAAYAAKAGLENHLFMPRATARANVLASQAMGADLSLVDGTVADAGRLALEMAQREELFQVATLQEPYRAEGKKTMGFEIAMQLGWRMPDAIVYPTGGGTGFVGMWKGFHELIEFGWLEGKLPKFIAIEPEGCQPWVKAFNEGAEYAEPWPDAQSIAGGIRVPQSVADYLILRIIRETGGTALAVSDEEMISAVKEMASAEGVFPCPEGAATLVGLKRLISDGFLDPAETIVLFNTGSGYKYLEYLKGI